VTREEVLLKARQLAVEGHTLIPADDPERGMRGFVAFQIHDGEEQSEILEWPLFGEPLTPEKQDVSAEELAEFLSNGPGTLALCDDPRRLRIGFVRYEPDRGRAVVRQARLTLVKGADDATRAAILGTRDRLMATPRDTEIALNP
jgi:hypothetical protein